MSYVVSLTATAEDQIRKCRLLGCADEIFHNLAYLGADPSIAEETLEGPFGGRPMHRFRLSRPPISLQITVHFAYEADEQHITILAFGVMRQSNSEWLFADKACA